MPILGQGKSSEIKRAYVRTKGRILQVDVSILDVSVPNNSARDLRKKLIEF